MNPKSNPYQPAGMVAEMPATGTCAAGCDCRTTTAPDPMSSARTRLANVNAQIVRAEGAILDLNNEAAEFRCKAHHLNLRLAELNNESRALFSPTYLRIRDGYADLAEYCEDARDAVALDYRPAFEEARILRAIIGF